MAFVLELGFDDASDIYVRGLWSYLAERNLFTPLAAAGYRPHISIAVSDIPHPDEDQLKREAVRIAASQPRFDIYLSYLGVFPTAEGVLYAGVTATEKLLNIHHHLFEQFAGLVTEIRPYYRSGSWVPHCTLAYKLSDAQLGEALTLCKGIFVPYTVTVTFLNIVEVTPTSYREIATVLLPRRLN